jgi:predicted ATPase/DNA-binding CsgD family transcriptional regulator
MTQTRRRGVGTLPGDLTSFVGRRQAAADVKHALSVSRLVTLIGVGGVGKSRLALRVAHELRRAFPDGTWLVELAAVHDPALVPRAAAAALGLLETSAREPEASLAGYLADAGALIVLDNCEHLLDGAAQLVTTLLSSTSRVRVLATSRAPLGVGAEHVWPVPPLSLPPVSALPVSPAPVPAPPVSLFPVSGRPGRGMPGQQEALALFEARAAAVLPGFRLGPQNQDTVARLCRRLDGVPLAIELAAARLRALSAEQILDRLEDRFQLLTTGRRDAPPRHQTLHAAVEWSFELCSESERLLWARCTVFAGEFDLDAAESVCTGDGLAVGDVLTGVARLVDQSVLAREGDAGDRARYRLLETIRQFGAQRLASAGETEPLRRRHRDYYLQLAEQSDAGSCGPRQDHWVRRLQAERANFWAALDYCMTTPGEARTGLRLAAALWFYWIGCGFVRDGRYWLGRALAADTEPSPERARALWTAGWIAFLQGEHAASTALLEQACDLARQLGDETALTYATLFLGNTAAFGASPEEGLALLEEARARLRRSGRWTAPGLLAFTAAAQAQSLLGRTDQAVALRDECQAISESLGERWALSWLNWNLSVGWWAAGDLRNAQASAVQALRLKRALGDQLGIPFCLELLAWVAGSEGEARRAAVLFGAVEHPWQRIGRPLVAGEPLLAWSEQVKARVLAELGGRVHEAARKQGARMCQDDVIAYALREKAAAEEMPSAAGPQLTRREQEVAGLVAAGLSNKDIASRLVIAQRTAEGHIEHILTKLGFNSRAQIAAWAAGRRGQPGGAPPHNR